MCKSKWSNIVNLICFDLIKPGIKTVNLDTSVFEVKALDSKDLESN